MTRHLPTLALLAALALALAWCGERRAHARTDADNARLRSEAAQAALREAGYQTTLARVAGDLRGALAERDHWRALAETPDVEPVAHVEATATAEARIETPVSTMVDSGVPIGYRGQYADSTFGLAWALALRPTPRFRADLRARVPLELVGYRLPDGSLGVTAASRDRRVRVQVDDFVWAPPEPPDGPSRLKWLLIGVGTGVLGWEMLR